MSTAMPPLTPEAPAPQPGMSEFSRLINVFFAPRKTFEDLKRKPSWWAPFVVISIFMLLAGFVATQKVDFRSLAEKRLEMIKFTQQQLEQASPEQREQLITRQAFGLKVSQYIKPLGVLIFGLIAAAILMAAFNFGFEASVSFSQSLAISFYASLPGILKFLLLILTLFTSSDPSSIDPDLNPVATNLGFFMNRDANKFLYGLASGLDILVIWSLVLTGMGFAIVSTNKKLTTGKAVGTVLVIYFLFILVFSGIGAAF